MKREHAVAILAQRDLETLGEPERAALLLNWWSLDESDPEYTTLPDSLKAELRTSEEPQRSADSRYDTLLNIALRRAYVGVRNEYLTRRLYEAGHSEDVQGAVELLATCPCCGYRSLEERGAYQICRVCFWEDDGSDNPLVFSVPNGMTLLEGRESFARLGAVSESARIFVLPDGRDRYMR